MLILLNSLEINKSFYKIPRCSTFKKWSEDVPSDFRFSVKVNREITHKKNLNVDPAAISAFMEAATGVCSKKGCLLIQFPGKITVDHFSTVEKILREIKVQEGGDGWRKAIEFRHSSWYIRETVELLDEFQATMVLHDMPKAKNLDYPVDSTFIYMRFHGPAGDYRGSYTDDFLESKAELIKNWILMGKEVFGYFNNTIGDAFGNACRLKKLIEEKL